MEPKVSIVILNWNGLNDTLECLSSIKKSDYSNYEIIVVDNASFIAEGDIIKKNFPEISLIKSIENLGYAGGNNKGIKFALENKAQYIWLLNNDTVIEPNTLSKLVLEGNRVSQIGLLSPIIYYYASRFRIQHCGTFIKWKTFEIEDLKNLEDMKALNEENTCLFGTALLIKSEVIKKIGYLNEKLFAYCEDIEYSVRALNAGYLNKMVTNAKIFHKEHYVDVTSKKNFPPHYFYYTTRNIFFFWIKNTFGLQRLKFLRHYLIWSMKRVGACKNWGNLERANATLDGLYCAMRNIGGKQNTKKRMPPIISKFILWHPYFFSEILESNFKKIFNFKNKIHKL